MEPYHEPRSAEADRVARLSGRATVPELPTGVVNRPRLFRRLAEALAYPITVVTGPAGWGKTQLLASWVRSPHCSVSCAWLSVERSDTDPRVFWPAVMSALAPARTRDREAGELVESLAPVVEALLKFEHPLVVVLDEVQWLEGSAVEPELAWLLLHLPPRVRVVLSGQYLPALPIAKLRVEGKVYSLSGKDLAFTAQEAAAMFAESGVDVSEETATALRDRTEGWSAGLRLAALSLIDGTPPQELLDQFGGDHVEVSDYLMSEVLSRLPADVENFLLRTSICERLTGDLAADLSARSDSNELLRWMARHNVFTTAENPRQHWFRYHPMLGELLRSRLDLLGTPTVRQLHLTASSWFAAHGMPVEAFEHTVRAESWSDAVSILTDHWLSLYLDGKLVTLRELINRLPGDVLAESELHDVRTAVSLGLGDGDYADAGALTGAGFDSSAGGHRRPILVEAAAHEPAEPVGIVGELTDDPSASVPARVVELERARLAGDLAAVVRTAHGLMSVSGADGHRSARTATDLRALALQQLGITEYWAGRRSDSETHLRQALSAARGNGRAYVQLGCLSQLASVLTAQDRLTDALRESEEAVALVREKGWELTGAAAELWHALGWTAYMRGDLDLAEQYLDGASMAVRQQDAAVSTTVLLVRALIVSLRGRKREALGTLDSAARVMERFRARYVFGDYVLGERARLRLSIGDANGARALLDAYPVDPAGPVHVSIAKAELLLSDGAPDLAIDLLRQAARTGQGLTDQRLQALVLMALLQAQAGEERLGVDTITEAVEMAAQERLVQPFLQFGKPVDRLLRAFERRGTTHGDFVALVRARSADLGPVSCGPPRSSKNIALQESLTERELDVLRSLDSLMSLPEISAELFVSVNTLKAHLRSLYRKLAVGSRREAVAKARSIGLP